jgi:hypothetical protein
MQSFQIVRIVPHPGAGVLFADGTQMLQRQGVANVLRGCLGRGHLKVQLQAALAESSLSYQEQGGAREQHSATGRYTSFPDSPAYIAPLRLQNDALEWIHRETGERPAGIHQQVLGYTFSSRDSRLSNCADDILLTRYRYDSVTRLIHDVNEDFPIARFRSDWEPTFTVGDVWLNRPAMEGSTGVAFEQALRTGFQQCDLRQGVDYCMRRLAWLASGHYLEANSGKKTLTYVLKRDVEHPAELSEQIVR